MMVLFYNYSAFKGFLKNRRIIFEKNRLNFFLNVGENAFYFEFW